MSRRRAPAPESVESAEVPIGATFSRRQVSGLLNGLEEPALVVSRDRRILAVNDAFVARFGTAEDPVGRHCYEVTHRYDRPCDEMGETCGLSECQATNAACRTLHIHHTPTGVVREEVTTHPVVTEAGKVTSFLEVLAPSRVGAGAVTRDRLVAECPACIRMLDLVRRVAPSPTAVLLLGESGTGKELVALAIHEMSEQASRPFVPVECAGLTESLFESELFGHEKGAFTGAVQRKPGLVEAAEGGTLFLDEVGEIPLAQQVKLLRLIETGMYRRVGSVEQRRARFRLICATHQDLAAMVEAGRFRADLYYRIAGFPIRVPPLRERIVNLPTLVEHLLARLGRPTMQVAPETMEVLRSYSFPGNVRELLNLLERACLLADGDTILPRHLPPELGGAPSPGPCAELPVSGAVPLRDLEQVYLRHLVDTFPGSKRELAQRLGVSERTLYRKLAAL